MDLELDLVLLIALVNIIILIFEGSGGKSGACPGGNLDSCIDACIPIKKVMDR